VLFQDRDGYIWVGTQAGLNRYDGNVFEIFSIQHGLKNDYINSITQDSSGAIWIGSYGGLSCWENHKFKNYTTENGLANNRVLSLAVDQKGNIWCGTGAGLSCWNGSEFYNFTEIDGLPQTIIYALLIDYTNKLWVGTHNGLYYLEGDLFVHFKNRGLQTQIIYELSEDREHHLLVGLQDRVQVFLNTQLTAEYSSIDGLNGLPPTTLYNASDSVLWVGTSAGTAMIYNGEVKFITTLNSLPFQNVKTILEDREGIIWLGGFGGLAKFLGRAFTTYTKTDGLGSDNVRPILRDRQGHLWAGTLNGLSRFNGKTWRNFTIKEGLNDNYIRCLFEDSKGILWIGTKKGLNYFDGSRFYDESNGYKSMVLSIVEDSSSTLWCSIRERGIFKPGKKGYKRVKAPDQSFLNAYLLVDRKGNVWASGENGLSRWDGAFWKTFTTADGLATNKPNFLCEDHKGNIWFGYHSSHGLTCYNGSSFKTYTTEDGLYNDAVYSIGVDYKKNLWIGTARGVDRYDGNKFINYGTAEGYASNESNANGFFSDYDGTIWFGTAEGLSHYNPRYDLLLKEKRPTVKIHHLFLENKEIPCDSAVTVPYSHNDLKVYIACLSYINKKRLNLRYRLLGYNENWETLKGREINYTNLHSGSYKLEIQGRRYRENWSESATASFDITPPFWQTWWFYLLCTLLFITIIYNIYKLRVRTIENQKKELEEKVNERTKELVNEREKLKLKNVEEGLFLLNPQFEIASQYSLELENIFNEKNLANRSFIDILSNKITEKEIDSIKEYLELMYNDAVEEDMLDELNPLTELMVNIEDINRIWSDYKYLTFKFRRIKNNKDKTIELIATVKDITNQIKLSKKLVETEAKSKKQMELILNILHVEPSMLQEFIEGFQKEIKYVESMLKDCKDDKKYEDILENIYSSMHLIKGNAGFLELNFFADKAHQFEDKISEIKEKVNLKGVDFLPLVFQLNDMKNDFIEVNNLLERISRFHTHFRPKRSYENQLLIQSIKNLIANISKEQGKEVKLVCEKFVSNDIPHQYKLLVKEILIQMIRNSISHGIEIPSERVKLNKTAQGVIDISTFLEDKSFGFRFKDDGQGLKIEKLRQKAKDSNKWEISEIEGWTEDQVAESIFISGISTSDKVDMAAGRGVGMDIIKKKIDNHQGKIKINFSEGQYCEFIVTLPLL
jgi:ligand-binding sensor domain-containing protein/signal transduction histidine kinase